MLRACYARPLKFAQKNDAKTTPKQKNEKRRGQMNIFVQNVNTKNKNVGRTGYLHSKRRSKKTKKSRINEYFNPKRKKKQRKTSRMYAYLNLKHCPTAHKILHNLRAIASRMLISTLFLHPETHWWEPMRFHRASPNCEPLLAKDKDTHHMHLLLRRKRQTSHINLSTLWCCKVDQKIMRTLGINLPAPRRCTVDPMNDANARYKFA